MFNFNKIHESFDFNSSLKSSFMIDLNDDGEIEFNGSNENNTDFNIYNFENLICTNVLSVLGLNYNDLCKSESIGLSSYTDDNNEDHYFCYICYDTNTYNRSGYKILYRWFFDYCD